MRRRVALLAVAALLVAPAAAQGHATVTSTAPTQGAALKSQPRQVVFRFSENVETRFGGVRVFDRAGKRVDAGATTQPTASSAAVRLRGELPDGPYTATYQVVSADSHPISGGYTFTVGRSEGRSAAAVANLLDDEQGPGPVAGAVFSAVKGGAYAATALLAGGALFLWLCWLPAMRGLAGGAQRWRDASMAVARRARGAGLAAAAAGVVLSVAGLVLQGAEAGRTSVADALSLPVVHDVLATDFGAAWSVRLVGFLALALVLSLRPAGARVPVLRPASLGATGLAPGRAPRPVAALAALAVAALVATPALAGHANATDPRALMLASDAAHVAAMSAWVGGVAFLVVVAPAATRVLAPGERSQLLATLVASFSTVALVSVAVLVATGVLQSIVHLRVFDDLLTAGYGRAILIKSVLVVALIAAGAVNRRRTLPRLRRVAQGGEPPGRAGLALRRAIRAEIALMAVAIGVTAALVGYAPPANSTATGPASLEANLGPARLELTVAPARVGPNEVHLYLFDRRTGAQYDKPKEVGVTARLPSKAIGPLALRPRKVGPGHYTVPVASFVPGGEWRLEISALVSEFTRYTTRVEVPIR